MDKNKCELSGNVTEVTSECSNMTLDSPASPNNDNSSEMIVQNATIGTVYDSSMNVNVVNNIENTPGSIELKSSIETIINNGKINSRPPSLNDDSRLVKFSLPSNSINLIQSNTQFLNKSRNFINFITEKSTNIMEKALLPQYLAVRNNNNDNNDAKISQSPQDLPDCPSEPGKINSIIPVVSEEDTSTLECSENQEKLELIKNNSISDSNNELNNLIDKKLSNNTTNQIDNNNELQTDIIIKLEKRIKELETQNSELELQNILSEIENRDRTIERLTNELRNAITNQEDMRKEYAAANKERESMVMKYAVGEKQLIETQKAKDNVERKAKELLKDNELLQNKLKHATNERAKICGILDVKCRELTDVQKEIEKLKGEIEIREIKLKWSQNKLKTEMETYKENGVKLEKALATINEMKDECDQVRRESQETIRKFQQLEINKTATLDEQLKEQQAQLILERHVTEDKELSRLQLQKEIETLENRQQNLIEENNTLNLKIQDLEKEQSIHKSKFNEIKLTADDRQKEIVDLNNKLSNLETMKLQLIHKEQCLVANETEVERLRRINQELQTDMDCCRQREIQMLDFTQKLTDKNVRLQSEFSAIESKANQLEIEQGPLRQCLSELKEKLKILEDNLAMEKSKRIEECEILAKHIAEQTQLSQNLTQMLEDAKGENCVLKRKHQSSIKELTRELQQCRKQLEAFETASTNNTLGQTSRTSSDTSLNTADISQNGVALPENSKTSDQPILYDDLDKNGLIEKILKMQRINVRRAEKIDFLEEHTRALVMELQRKTKIIQNYILHENFDAMGNNERDKYKAELVRHGGIMASVYNHKVSDDTMTLELSLEINQKLQTVLEDALLKNITLKDNIDTLGEEIARLSIQNQQLQKMTK